jgi:type II secretory pathway predicted ATPase ExeA/TPR repeat protein
MPYNAATASEPGNSESLYLANGYAEILEFLCAPVTGRANVKVLVSEPGLGKTVLLRSAIERLKAEARTALVFWTQFKPKDFLAHLLFEMGSSEPPPLDLHAAQDQFENLLHRAALDGKRFVLAIDEAHKLSPATLNRLSTLLDRDTAHPPQVTLLLAGLPELRGQFAEPEAKGMRERIAGVMTIAPLNAEQTAEYVEARITALGVGPVAPEQLANIAVSSGGVLRIIDNLCLKLLLQNESRQQHTRDALRLDTSADEESSTTATHISRIAAWAASHPGMWSGTMAELAAATGISIKEISDAVENRTHELRRDGIAAAITRSPGKPRMITLSQLEREHAPESHEVIPELHEEVIPELHEEDANRQQAQEGQELETKPRLNQEPANEIPLGSTKADGDPGSANRRTGSALRTAIVLVLIMGVAGGLLYLFLYLFLYLKSPNSAHQASSASQPVSAPKPAPEADEVTGLRERADEGDIVSQTALADRHGEGNGVLRDNNVALELEQAASKGDSVAQHQLGLALSSGSDGVAADRVAAYAWLVMAQNGGQTMDQATLDVLNRSLTRSEIRSVRYQLGLMYEQGIGCVADLVSADEWFLLGAAVGDARSRAESAVLERRMSPGQISQAHARSDDWLRRHTIKTASNAAAR